MSLRWGLPAFALTFVAFGSAPNPVVAATRNTTIGVSAMVEAACLVSVAPAALGNQTGEELTPTASVSDHCTNSAPYSVGLRRGLRNGSNLSTRTMSGAAFAASDYLVDRDGAPTRNRTNVFSTPTSISRARDIPIRVNGAGQTGERQSIAPGGSTGTILVTVTF